VNLLPNIVRNLQKSKRKKYSPSDVYTHLRTADAVSFFQFLAEFVHLKSDFTQFTLGLKRRGKTPRNFTIFLPGNIP